MLISELCCRGGGGGPRAGSRVALRWSCAGAAMSGGGWPAWPTCAHGDSGDTHSLLLFLSGAPNEVITVLQTGVTRTFDPCPSPHCNVNSSCRHLYPAPSPPSSRSPSLIGRVVSRAVTPAASGRPAGRRVWKSRWAAVF